MNTPFLADDRLGRLVRRPRPISSGGGRYSSLVRSLRILLPLSAMALLLLAVIWPQFDWRGSLGVGDLPSSIKDVESQELRMISARLVGTDDEGRPFVLRAAEAQQFDGVMNRVLLHSPEGEIWLEDGNKIQLTANEGEYSKADEEMVFRGNVVVIHDLGYRLETELAIVDIPAARAYGDRPVSGTGPEGDISGSGFEILDKGQTVRVLGRSKLIFKETPEE